MTACGETQRSEGEKCPAAGNTVASRCVPARTSDVSRPDVWATLLQVSFPLNGYIYVNCRGNHALLS